MNSSVEGVVPSLDIIIGADRLSVDAPGTGWKSVRIDPLVVDIVYQLMKDAGGRLQLKPLDTASTTSRRVLITFSALTLKTMANNVHSTILRSG